MTNPCFMPLGDLMTKLEDGELTSEAIVRSCLDRIAEREPTVGAWDFIDPELALAQARARDGEPRRSPLHGIPVGVKDVLDVVGMPAAWGDQATYGHRRPERDAPVVQRLRELGAVILGKTAVSRFGFWWPGKARNPHDPSRTPGSSSSGSGAAVADFMCPLAIGTQTSGSVMRPAAFCGVVGLMGSHGWITWANSRDYAASFDRVGVYARTMAEARIGYTQLTGRPAPAPDSRRLRIGLYRTHQWPEAKPYVQAHFEASAERLVAAGHVVEEIVLPPIYDLMWDAQPVIGEYESYRSFIWEMEHARDSLVPGLEELLLSGKSISIEAYNQAIDLMRSLRARFADDIRGFDLIMTPGSEGEAPAATGVGSNMFIRQWMMTTGPIIAVPAGTGPNGLPLGVQFIGRPEDDAAHVGRVAVLAEVLQGNTPKGSEAV